jgi:hypothetical protein
VSHSIHLSPAPDAGPFFETAQHPTGWPLAPPHRQLEAKPLAPEKLEGLWPPRRATVERAFLSAKKAPPERGSSFVMLRKGKGLFFRTKANPERGRWFPSVSVPSQDRGPISQCRHPLREGQASILISPRSRQRGCLARGASFGKRKKEKHFQRLKDISLFLPLARNKQKS